MNKLMPIDSCKDCDFLGRTVKAGIKDVKKGEYRTFCTHLIEGVPKDAPPIIFYSEHPCPESYRFPKWCPLIDDAEIIHYWEMHGRGLCQESVWGTYPSLDVVRIMKFTLHKKDVTCDKCKELLANMDV